MPPPSLAAVLLANRQAATVRVPSLSMPPPPDAALLPVNVLVPTVSVPSTLLKMAPPLDSAEPPANLLPVMVAEPELARPAPEPPAMALLAEKTQLLTWSVPEPLLRTPAP